MNKAKLIELLLPLVEKLGGKYFMKLPLKVRQFLTGVTIALPFVGGSVVISSTVDSCNVEYVKAVDINGNYLVNEKGDTLSSKQNKVIK